MDKNQRIICSGPVIIENNKVLLVKEKKTTGNITPWLFPGGKAEPNETDPIKICQREVKEELGIEIDIIKQLPTLEASSGHDNLNKKYLLYHYLAKRIGDIKPGDNIIEWGWFDINNLPKDCHLNVYEIIKNYKI